jgi:hypothetical protein
VLGKLLVRSIPEGGIVYVDGKAAGTTPLELDIKPGKHHVRVELAGYQAVDEDEDVRDAMQTSVVITLSPAPRDEPAKKIAKQPTRDKPRPIDRPRDKPATGSAAGSAVAPQPPHEPPPQKTPPEPPPHDKPQLPGGKPNPY